jgi:hypothetical protein
VESAGKSGNSTVTGKSMNTTGGIIEIWEEDRLEHAKGRQDVVLLAEAWTPPGLWIGQCQVVRFMSVAIAGVA